MSIQVNGDLLDEIDESFLVILTNAPNAVITDPQGVGTITDNDPLPELAVNDVTVTEVDAGTVNANFTVSLNAPSGRPVSVAYATANGTAIAPADYTAVAGTVNLAAGQTTQQVTVAVNADLLDEEDEDFTINLSSPVDATIADPQGLGSITDNDPLPALSVNDVTVTEGNSGTTNAVFTVTLGAPSARTVTVDYATADGSATSPADYAAATGPLTFAPGQTTRTVTVLVNGDLVNEGTETYFLNLSNPGNATIVDHQGGGTIIDDDGAPTLSVNDVTVAEGNAGSVSATFTVSLTPASGQTVSVGYSTLDGTATSPADYTGRRRQPRLPARPDDADLHGAGQRRPARRDRRELHRPPLQSGQRDDRGRGRAWHDHRQRPAADPGDRQRHRRRGQLRVGQRDLHSQPEHA